MKRKSECSESAESVQVCHHIILILALFHKHGKNDFSDDWSAYYKKTLSRLIKCVTGHFFGIICEIY